MDERMRRAVERASDAFWREIAEAYPEARTGDLGPENIFPFDQSVEEAVRAWVHWNVGQPDDHKKEAARLDALTVDDVVVAYRGERGACCCGCSGVYYYNSKHVRIGSMTRGYSVEAIEVHDEEVARILAEVKAQGSIRCEFIDDDCIAADVGDESLVLHLLGKEKNDAASGDSDDQEV